MIGNLLGAGKSVSFFLNRDGGSGFINTIISSNVVNPKIAENNSPLPQDRISFRYNLFANAETLTGLSDITMPAPNLGVGRTLRPSVNVHFDVNQYTFSGEKTFFDGLVSAEVRVPFQTTLSSNINYLTGIATGMGPALDAAGKPIFQNQATGGFFQGGPFPAVNAINVTPTPQNTRGSDDTEFGNMSVILKGLLYRSDVFAFSGGVGFGIPTANDTHVTVTDYLGSVDFNNVGLQRIRDFNIKNQTWGVSPFLAMLFTPNDRFFAQGFLQIEVPVNKSEIDYTETIPINANPGLLVGQFLTDPSRPPDVRNTPFSVTDHIRDQTLMHLDFGTGYWVFRDSHQDWLTGLAPTLELHYTHSLNSADVVTLPRDPAFEIVPLNTFSPSPIGPIPNINTINPPAPTVGSLRGPIDILDLTGGVTALISDRATIATAVSVPLRSGSNKTYDWEFQLQLNYYFGGPNRSGGFFAPASF